MLAIRTVSDAGKSNHLQAVNIKRRKMQPHQERVFTEKHELDEKIEKLRLFIWQPDTAFSTLDTEEQVRLRIQYHIMKQYSEILGQRIAAFEK